MLHIRRHWECFKSLSLQPHFSPEQPHNKQHNKSSSQTLRSPLQPALCGWLPHLQPPSLRIITPKNGAEIKCSTVFVYRVLPAGQRKQNQFSLDHLENVRSLSVGSPYATQPTSHSFVLYHLSCCTPRWTGNS